MYHTYTFLSHGLKYACIITYGRIKYVCNKFVFYFSARTSHITQIAAVRGKERFSCYVMPQITITPKASEITGITVNNGKMFHHSKQVDAVPVKDAFSQLCAYLEKSNNNILIGHNIQTYDCPLLFNALASCGEIVVNKFCDNVKGFVDTRKLFKITHSNQKSFAQQNLLKNIMGVTYDAHDALEDVVALQKLVDFVHIEKKPMQKASFTVEYMKESYQHSLRVRQNMPSLKTMIEEKVVSSNMAKTIAGSGLAYKHLKLAYERDCIKGIESLFTEIYDSCSRKVRVTKSKNIIDSVSDHFSKLQSK